MIRFEDVTFTYPQASTPVLRNVDFDIAEGSMALVVGPTGSGKSTLLGAVNGIVPRFTGGLLQGRVTVDGRETSTHRLKDMADLVGVVGQNPARRFTTETVESELAYTMEQLGIEPNAMRKRVEETLDLLGLAPLRHRRLTELSGGEVQRVAIGSVLTAHPRVLVLDEPTSALDPVAAEEVLATVIRLVHDAGITVLMAEHRLERVIHYADEMVVVTRDGNVDVGGAAEMMARSELAPPVVELGRVAGWSPLPLSVRDARRSARDLVARLGPVPERSARNGSEPAVTVRGLSVTYGDVVALERLHLELRPGVTALMGRNGSGKSSLLWALQGSVHRERGHVEISGTDPALLDPASARKLVSLVPQNPSDLLYLDSVGAECSRADTRSKSAPGTCRNVLDRLVPGLDDDAHPADLSEGEKLALVLALQLTAVPSAVLLDEPTRGLDYPAKRRLGELLCSLAAEGVTVMVATHDVEFVAEHADRVVVLADGEVVAEGPTASVVTASPAFSPQVTKVLSPATYLTVAEVRSALESSP